MNSDRDAEHVAVTRAGTYLDGDEAGEALRLYLGGRFTGGWFETAGRPPTADPRTGWPTDPRPDELTIEDILALRLLGLRLRTGLIHRIIDAALGPSLRAIPRDSLIDRVVPVGKSKIAPWKSAQNAWGR